LKPESIAKQIINHLGNAKLVPEAMIGLLLDLVQAGQTVPAYRLMVGTVQKGGKPYGWNSVWVGNDLYSWFGSVVTSLPLRLAACELSAGDSRTVLTNYLQMGESFPDNPTGRVLKELGGESGALKLLQRLNLDCRELPHIERWHWSGRNGMAYLSDGNRVQINQEVVWGRAITGTITSDGVIPSEVLLFLAVAKSTQEVIIPELMVEPSVVKLIERLAWYGICRRECDGVTLLIPTGEIVANSDGLWGEKC